MRIKSGVWYWLAVASGAVGMLYGSKILSLWANSLAAFLKTRFAPLITPTMAATAVHSSALPTKRALLPRQLCSPDFLIRMEAARA